MRKSPGVTKVAEEPEEVIEIADIFSLPLGPDEATAEKKPAAEPPSDKALIDAQVNKLLGGKS